MHKYTVDTAVVEFGYTAMGATVIVRSADPERIESETDVSFCMTEAFDGKRAVDLLFDVANDEHMGFKHQVATCHICGREFELCTAQSLELERDLAFDEYDPEWWQSLVCPDCDERISLAEEAYYEQREELRQEVEIRQGLTGEEANY